MKVQLPKQPPGMVLLYRLEKSTPKGGQLAEILEELRIPARAVAPLELPLCLGSLCGRVGCEAPRPAVGVPPLRECMVMCGLSESQLNALLGRIRGMDLPLKAILTPHNQEWSFGALMEELEREDHTFAALRRLNGAMERALAVTGDSRPALLDSAMEQGKAALQARHPCWEEMESAAEKLEALLA